MSCFLDNQPPKSSGISSSITSITSPASNNENKAPATSQRRSDALLEQLTQPLKTPVTSMGVVSAPPTSAATTPPSKDNVDAIKEPNANQQSSIDIKVCIVQITKL